MNMHSAPQRTAAETAFVEAFDRRVSELPGDGAVAVKRDAAIERLKAGLPTRRVEAWHYTDLRRLLASVPDFDPTLRAEAADPLLDASTVLTLLNGEAVGDAEIDQVRIRRLEEMLVDGSLAPALGFRDADDVIGALNTAFLSDGWFIDVPQGVRVVSPIEIQCAQAGGQTHTRVPVRIGAGASVTIIERHFGSGNALSTMVDNLVVGAGAEVTWVILQDQPTGATHLGQFNAEIAKDARLRLFVMNLGGRLVRQEIRVRTTGEGADFMLRAANLLAGQTHADVTLVLDHAVPATTSTEVVRNVVTDRAHGVFQGRINVDRLAQKTDARMACNTLLLSDEAEFSTKPELEIFADDVACGHGATVTEIDRNHLFYLMARGIDEKTARGLLIKAFLAEIIEELDDETLVTALEARLDAWFAAHG